MELYCLTLWLTSTAARHPPGDLLLLTTVKRKILVILELIICWSVWIRLIKTLYSSETRRVTTISTELRGWMFYTLIFWIRLLIWLCPLVCTRIRYNLKVVECIWRNPLKFVDSNNHYTWWRSACFFGRKWLVGKSRFGQFERGEYPHKFTKFGGQILGNAPQLLHLACVS